MNSVYPIYKEHKDHHVRIESAKTIINALVSLDLYSPHQKELISNALWKITEADGKYKLRYWSEGSLSATQSNWHHEHVCERKELVSRLLNGEMIDDVIQDVIACVVTRDEHKKLTQSMKQGWARYMDVSIRVYDSKEKVWLFPVHGE